MTPTMLNGRAPANDVELVRSFHDRLRRIENATTARVGEFVFAAQDGALTVTKPGASFVLGAAPDFTDAIGKAIDQALKGVVSAGDLSNVFDLDVAINQPIDILGQISAWIAGSVKGIIDGWTSALHLVGVPTPDQLMGLLRGLLPAAIPQFNGTTIPAAVAGFVNNLNGTVSYAQQQGQAALNTLIQQADGSWVTMAQVVQHQAEAALAAGAANVAQAAAAGQQAIDHGIAAFNGGLAQAGQSAQQFGSTIQTQFAAWTNPWLGTSAPVASGSAMTEAQMIAAAAAAAQAQVAEEIRSQLPRFYGASGTAGANASQNFTGLTSLPAGFTQISSPLMRACAKYDTPALTDSETVSGMWSSSDHLAKFIWMRGSADGSYCVYARIQNNEPFTGGAKTEIGTLVAGVKTVFGTTITLPGSGNAQANQNYALSATDYTFTLAGPGGLSQSVTDALHVSQMGALYRYGGFGTDGTASPQVAMTNSGTYNFPAGFTTGDMFDYGGWGGGGGGGGGATGGSGVGYGFPGSAGAPMSGTLTIGTEIPLLVTSFGVAVGNGGGGGAGGAFQPGAPGGTTSLSVAGYGTATAAGGAGGIGVTGGFGGGNNGSTVGAGAPNITWNNLGYTGGFGGLFGGAGAQPGGGGGGGGAFGSYPGSAGGAGGVYITPISVKLPGNMLNWVFYDSGPTAGPATVYVATATNTYNGTTYSDMTDTTTDQVTVNIGPSKLALVFISAQLIPDNNSAQAWMSYAISGANTLAASDDRAIYWQNSSAYYTSGDFGSAHLLTSAELPNVGATTFKLKYRDAANGATTIAKRRLAVIPL